MNQLDRFDGNEIKRSIEEETLQAFVNIDQLNKNAFMLHTGSDGLKYRIEKVVTSKKLQYKRESGFIEQ
jgi:hypothetical protein